MIALFITAAVGAAAFFSQVPATTSEVEPMIGAPVQVGPDPALLHAKVRTEPRDNAWASATESAARARLMQIPLIGKEGNELRVTCATDLCEMAGTIIGSTPAPKDYDPKLPQAQAQMALQQKQLADDLAKLGLKMEANLFTGAQGKPDRIVYLLYYSRAK